MAKCLLKTAGNRCIACHSGSSFFVASTRIVSKQRNPVTGKTRKKYDKARTPYERVMEQMKAGARKRNLVALRESLDPIELQKNGGFALFLSQSSAKVSVAAFLRQYEEKD